MGLKKTQNITQVNVFKQEGSLQKFHLSVLFQLHTDTVF